jgi:hypothetical protein
MAPSAVGTGNFQYSSAGGTPVLTDGVIGPVGSGTSLSAMAGYENGAGDYLVYTLPHSADGYNVTNITVFSGWTDYGRAGQTYAVSYSTVDNPTAFVFLTFVNYDPSGSSPVANRVMLTDSAGAAIAANVAAIKFDFTVPMCPYGYNSYMEITVEGTPASTLTPQPVLITTSNETSTASFVPTWTIETDSLIAGQTPSSSVGDPTVAGAISGFSVLTDGAVGAADSTAYAGCGSGSGCSSLTYSLNTTATGSSNGYDLTNIVTYTGWQDYGRDGQFYNVSYSTIAAPTTFIPLTSVEFNPNIQPGAGESANRVDISSLIGALAKNVSSVKFDFPQDNSIDYGWSGYAQIIVEGTNSAPSAVPTSAYLVQDIAPTHAETVVGDQVIFTAAYSNTPPVSVQWQKITAGPLTNNINTGVVTVTSNGVVTSTLTLNNVQLTNSGTYQLQGLNAANGKAAPSYTTAATLAVGAATQVGNVILDYAEQASSAAGFYPAWTLDTNADLIFGFPIIGDGSQGSVTAGAGSYSLDGAEGDPSILDDGALGDALSSLVSCGRVDFGAGVSMTYYLNTSSAQYGFNLTNITIFGGWPTDVANEQHYQVLYSTVSAPASFVSMGTFYYMPADATGLPCATRTTLIPTTTALAENVAAVEIYFSLSSDDSKNVNGYSEIFIGGTPAVGIVPAATQGITPLTAEDVVGSSLTLEANFSGATSLQWQKNGTNITGQTAATLTLTNLQLSDTATNGGYALVAYNAVGSSSSRPCQVIVDPSPAPVSNVVTAFAYQSSDATDADPFAPTWDVSALSSSLIYQQDPPGGGYGSGDFTGGNDYAGGLPVLTDGSYGVFAYDGSNPAFADGGPGAGQYVIYTLGTTAAGYNVTNIQIASGWADNGRNSQFYTVSYSTVANPITFIPITAVKNSPTFAGQSVIRATITPATGVLASNVYEIKVDFTQPPNVPNGYSGYSEISVFGSPSLAPPSGPVITAVNETIDTPDWVVASPNLIAGQLPGSYDTNPNDSFTANNNGGLATLTDGVIGTSAGMGASCGGTGEGGGTFITYTPASGSWDLTNIVVYTGWGDFGRAGQFYNLSYSTVAAPTTFIPLASITYDPNYNDGTPWATSVTIAPPIGQTFLATNVAAVNFDFTPQGTQDFGFSSYTEIVLQGTNVPSTVVQLPSPLPIKISGGNLILTGTGGTPNSGYTWLTTTNLTAPINWTTNTTGTLDGAGAYSNSIPVNTSTPVRFFQLRLP